MLGWQNTDMIHLFLSHNHRDKDVATPLAAQLRLVGVDVWLDDWEIKPGDSIIGKVNEALSLVDTVVLLWSKNSAGSRWVDSEMAAAIDRRHSDGSVRIIPVRLDETELPPLLRPLKWLELDYNRIDVAVRQIAGIGSYADLIIAIQNTIAEAGFDFRYFHGYGVAIGCPKCGAPSNELKGWTETDYQRDDEYAGVRCLSCGWNDGGEIW